MIMAYSGNYTTSTAIKKSSRAEIEFLFHKVLSPITKAADPNLISQFCQKLTDIEDAQQAADLIVQKLLSTQEWEVLVALYVLEACVKNCGEPMQEIVGRFRFLNEMIKLISPKYYGSRTSEASKKKVIELIYSWSRDMPNKPKIKEAYEMIKKQGIVEDDPVYVEGLKINVTPRETNPIFDDQEKSKQLARLLKSKNPADLEMANKIIKNMVRQDEIKTEKISTRINELEKINNNIKLLSEMLFEYDPKQARSSEKETIKYLYEELEKLQPNLIKLATETDEHDESIGEILKTNDSCESIIKKYQSVFDSKFSPDDALVNLNSMSDEMFNPVTASNSSETNKAHSTKDLQDLFSTDNMSELYAQKPVTMNPVSKPLVAMNSTPNIFDDLVSVDQDFTPLNAPSSAFMMNTSSSLNSFDQAPLQPVAKADSNSSLKNTTKSKQESKPFDDLSELSKALMGDSLNFTPTSELNQMKSQKMNDMIKATNTMNPAKPTSLITLQSNGVNTQSYDNKSNEDASHVLESLNLLFIELKSIKPAVSIPPLNLYDKNNLKIVLHFARDSPAKNVHVIVISTTSMNMQSEIKNFLFQAAVTKNMRVKLQPASSSDLPAYNPILPLMAITQIMLIANPHQEPVRLKFKVSYTSDGKDYVDNDEVKNFPLLT